VVHADQLIFLDPGLDAQRAADRRAELDTQAS
jgi:hypothetical protein